MHPTKLNIYAVGFMASGKSFFAKRFSEKLSLTWFDTDNYLVKKHEKSITRMFHEEGETWFREQETKALLFAQKSAPLLVSPGGGAILSEENQRILKTGLVVYLDTPLESIKARLKTSTHRPLAQKNHIDALYASRKPLYESIADVSIDLSAMTESTLLNLIRQSYDAKSTR